MGKKAKDSGGLGWVGVEGRKKQEHLNIQEERRRRLLGELL